MRKFDTKVQHLKYKVLREVAREAWDGHSCLRTCSTFRKSSFRETLPQCAAAFIKSALFSANAVKLAMGGDKD